MLLRNYLPYPTNSENPFSKPLRGFDPYNGNFDHEHVYRKAACDAENFYERRLWYGMYCTQENFPIAARKKDGNHGNRNC
jgi:hypothetical protein